MNDTLKMEGHSPEYGERYEQILKIKGLNGKVANVLTAWIKEGTSQKRLTSVYVGKEKENET